MDGEDNLTDNWEKPTPPPGTYVWKDGDQFSPAQFLSDSDSDIQPQHPDDSDSANEEPAISGWALESRVRIVTDTSENPLPGRPERWSDKSSKFEGLIVAGIPQHLQPVSPSKLSEEVHSDIMAFDMSGEQTITDNETGRSNEAGTGQRIDWRHGGGSLERSFRDDDKVSRATHRKR
jgi:hypothetical protein